jgi:outer membrane protein TolC
MKKHICVSLIVLLLPLCMDAQDTVQVSMQTFIERGIENSGQIKYEKQNVNLAQNQIDQAKSNRFVPSAGLNTQHGAVPGVISQRNDLSKNQHLLDPELENDWENWGVFTRAEVSAVQPLFTWGALKNAVNAAESAAVAARERFESEKADYRKRLFELYQSYLLTSEILTLLEEAEQKISDVQNQLEEQREDGDSEFDESELYKFEVFKSEFAIRAAEVREEAAMTQQIWNYVLQADENTVYVPDTRFLDPTSQQIRELDYYRTNAIANRSEIAAIEAGIDAAEFGMKAQKQRNYPSLFLGLNASYANIPN